jgi:hypothetical protein
MKNIEFMTTSGSYEAKLKCSLAYQQAKETPGPEWCAWPH